MCPCGLRGLPIPLRMLDRCPRLESFQWGLGGVSGPTPPSSQRYKAHIIVARNDFCPRMHRSPASLPASIQCQIPRFQLPRSFGHSPLDSPTLHTLTIVGTLHHPPGCPHPPSAPGSKSHDRTRLRPPPQWAIELSAFFERSKPMLRQLSISTTEMLEPGLLRILALTPHLRSLTLGGFFTAKLIHALHPSPPLDAPLCPCLQNLRVAFICNCPDGLYGAMLRARWGTEAHTYGVACLKCAHVEFMDNSHDRDKADMTALHAEGMQGFIS
ncbi:hypothetical protein BD779DRAFT_781845 [Infundibulicybe gibba]|nr:hypothetical protein BD779DRAFT_781845 [Infundibulicybe gibba]